MRITKKMLTPLKSYRIHVLCWLAFISYESVLLIGLEVKVPDFIPLIFHFVLNIIFFYAFSWIMMHWAWRADLHDWWRIPVSFFFSLIIYLLLKLLLDHAVYNLGGAVNSPSRLNIKLLSGYLYRGVFFILGALGYCYLLQFIKERAQKELLLQSFFNEQILAPGSSSQSRLPDLLYTPMNMHHLFSALNFLYLKLCSYDANLAQLALCTTDLIRYYIDPDTAKGINLEKELMQVESLIQMDQLMHPLKPRLHWSMEKGLEETPFSASVLIPLTIMLLRFSANGAGSPRGHLSLFKIDNQLCLQGRDIQPIAEAAKLKNELEKLNVYLYGQHAEATRIEYQLQNQILNFTLLFKGQANLKI